MGERNQDTPTRAPDRDHRLVTVRGAGGTSRQIEVRRAVEPALFRAEGDDPGFGGYASTFYLIDSYGTAVAPGAFTKTLQERGDRLLVLWQHNPDWPIGKSIAHEQDGIGLNARGRVSETGYGRDAMALLRDEVPLGLSIGFRTIRERPATEQDPLRFGPDTPEWIKRDPTLAWVIEEIKLYEYSLVSFPANSEAMPTVVYADPAERAASALLEDLRAGRLDAAGRALVAEIAAAYSAAPDGRKTEPRTDPQARADREFAMAFLAREMGLSLEQLTCAA